VNGQAFAGWTRATAPWTNQPVFRVSFSNSVDGAPAGTDLEAMKTSGYLTEALVIDHATRAGFVLEARSEVNANPKDTADHPNGVWTLPPTNRHDPGDAAKYAAIGESDRMTLRFRKPAR